MMHWRPPADSYPHFSHAISYDSCVHSCFQKSYCIARTYKGLFDLPAPYGYFHFHFADAAVVVAVANGPGGGDAVGAVANAGVDDAAGQEVQS